MPLLVTTLDGFPFGSQSVA